MSWGAVLGLTVQACWISQLVFLTQPRSSLTDCGPLGKWLSSNLTYQVCLGDRSSMQPHAPWRKGRVGMQCGHTLGPDFGQPVPSFLLQAAVPSTAAAPLFCQMHSAKEASPFSLLSWPWHSHCCNRLSVRMPGAF